MTTATAATPTQAAKRDTPKTALTAKNPLSWDRVGADVPISLDCTGESLFGYGGSRRQILNYLRARYYDPSTAQFLSRDPMVATTRSPYGYVGGNPLNGTDPSGLWCPATPSDCVPQAVKDAAGDVASQTTSWAGDLKGAAETTRSAVADAASTVWEHAPVHNWRQPVAALLVTVDTLSVLTADVGAVAAPFVIAPLCGPFAPWCAAAAVAGISAPIAFGSYAYFRYLLPAEFNEAFGGPDATSDGSSAARGGKAQCS